MKLSPKPTYSPWTTEESGHIGVHEIIRDMRKGTVNGACSLPLLSSLLRNQRKTLGQQQQINRSISKQSQVTRKKKGVYISDSRNSRNRKKEEVTSKNTGTHCSPYFPFLTPCIKDKRRRGRPSFLSPHVFFLSKKNGQLLPLLSLPFLPVLGLVASFISFPLSPPTDKTAGRIVMSVHLLHSHTHPRSLFSCSFVLLFFVFHLCVIAACAVRRVNGRLYANGIDTKRRR